MNTIFPITVSIAVTFLAVYHLIRNIRSVGPVDSKVRVVPYVLSFCAIMLLCNIMCGESEPLCLLFDIMITVLPLSAITLSIWPHGKLLFPVRCYFILSGLMSVYYILCALNVIDMFSSRIFLLFADISAVIILCVTFYLIYRRICDVKSLVRSGNVWSYMTLCVDVFYVAVPSVVMLLLHSVCGAMPQCEPVAVYVAALLLFLEVVALSLRISEDSVFVLMHKHERVIVESMKLSSADVCLNVESQSDDQYKELYGRIQDYFEKSRPYLDGDLTINDLVKVVYSNKVYISKAICRYTGRNFRQFVNYYRVMFSLETFRDAPELKVSELAEMSGFNTVVTYTMAFRLFMNETPSEWCRKERTKILKQKK